ncbi:MAG: hypothetical protein RR246_03480 [Clostridia bacterium]
MNNKSKSVALGGVLAALAVALMSIGSLIPSLDMSAAFISGFVIIIARIEINRKTTIGVYAVSGLLSALLLPNRFTAICFICLGGLYPILKEYIEVVKSRVLQIIIKIAAFNVLYTAIILLANFLGIPLDDIVGLKWLIYVVGNITFLLYDFTLTLLISKYYIIFKKGRK